MRLHVVLGISSGAELSRVFPEDRVGVCRDVFTEGPCRFTEPLDLRGWLHRRLEWWSAESDEPVDDEAELPGLEADALAADLASAARFDA